MDSFHGGMHHVHEVGCVMSIPRDLSQIDVNLLVALQVLLQERSVTRAGLRLHLSQSATSHKLKKIRALFDDPLLVPGVGGKLELTPLAEAISIPLAGALRELGCVLSVQETFEPGRSKRRFVLRMPDGAEAWVIPRVAAAWADEAPGIQLECRPWRGEIYDLERGEIDLHFGMVPAQPPGWLNSAPLRESPYECILHRDCKPKRGALSLSRYLALGHVVISNRTDRPSLIDGLLADRGLRRTIAYRVSSFTAAPLVIAQAPQLVLTIQRGYADWALQSLPLRAVKPPIAVPRVRASMVWHKRNDADPGHRWLRSQVPKLLNDRGA